MDDVYLWHGLLGLSYILAMDAHRCDSFRIKERANLLCKYYYTSQPVPTPFPQRTCCSLNYWDCSLSIMPISDFLNILRDFLCLIVGSSTSRRHKSWWSRADLIVGGRRLVLGYPRYHGVTVRYNYGVPVHTLSEGPSMWGHSVAAIQSCRNITFILSK